MQLKIIEFFAGIGAFSYSAKKINEKYNKQIFKTIAISDWYLKSTIAYAAIYNDVLNIKNNINYLDVFENKTLSFNADSAIKKYKTKSEDWLNLAANSFIQSNNLGNINEIDIKKLDELNGDIWTYSFPCQGISSVNVNNKGILDKTSKSSIIWNFGKVLKDVKNKPKYLILENVPPLITKYQNEYQKWLDYLKELGYSTITRLVNAYELGSLQIRKRVIAISYLGEIAHSSLDFYFHMAWKKPNLKKLKEKYLNTFDIENKKTIPFLITNTQSRKKILDKNINLSDLELAKKRNYKVRTLLTSPERFNIPGFLTWDKKLENNNYLPFRHLSIEESLKLQNFDDKYIEIFDKLEKMKILNKHDLYKLIGNSIDTKITDLALGAILTHEEIMKGTKIKYV
ncbi:DNA cytosine methyltransferase [[Mycoplasma] collis]|uniref:DNA cytosine methyltransferase n=1 Tax=[Mycoplasma] collis TaxID=2127 RepID=UPI00051C5921|nr:DNA cytosine methyltransferase [[Mycoplasma] collis]